MGERLDDRRSPYRFEGFLAPIEGEAVNEGKTGRTYPVKWRLEKANGAPIADEDALEVLGSMSAESKPVDCSTLEDLPAVELDGATATVGTSLRYVADDDQFVYNFKAPSMRGCRTLSIENADGAQAKKLNFDFTR